MDKLNDCIIPECGHGLDLTKFKLVVGTKQLKKALNQGSVQQVFLASNADPAITQMLEGLCQLNQTPYVWVRSMQDLGRACGIDVGAAAAAVLH
jgi:large subunit ribosomal protein L7A